LPPLWNSAKLGRKSLLGQLILSRQNDDGRRKPVDASKRKRIVRSVNNRPRCYDINWRNRNVKRIGS
jgi:hypothetical protein